VTAVPNGWALAPLGHLIAKDGLFSDGDWVESKDQDPNGSIRLLQLADVGDGTFIDKSNRYINEEQFRRLRCTEVFEGDILIARMPHPLGRACLVPRLAQRCVTVVDIAIVRPGKSSVLPEWLMRFLNAPPPRRAISEQSSGTTRRRISRSKLEALSLPIPPIAEQTRIADKVGALLARADACRERLDRVPAILKRFRQSVLAAATNGELTADWRRTNAVVYDFRPVKIREVVRDIRYGTSKKCSYTRTATPVLRIPNLIAGRVDHSDLKFARFDSSEVEKLALEPGDLLVIRSNGSLDLVGRAALVGTAESGFLYAGYLIRLRLNLARVVPEYLCFALSSPALRSVIELMARSTTGVNNINSEELSALVIPLPPLPEQVEAVRRAHALLSAADRIESSLSSGAAALEAVIPSVLAKAFRGELVPQDPNDEPASELLARIRREKQLSEDAAHVPFSKDSRKPKRRRSG
jgi:type I restriction enzyme S subunit